MENYIFSIHSKHAENIYNGKKLFEFRTVLPKTLMKGDRIWLYETAPVKAITGYFICSAYISAANFNDHFWDRVKYGAEGASKEGLQEYFQNKRPKAVPVLATYKLSNPIHSDQVGWKRPPQNFAYVSSIPNCILTGLGRSFVESEQK